MRYVGSSIQFLVPLWSEDRRRALVSACSNHSVELKWLGDANPVGFTSRYDSLHYTDAPKIRQTLTVLQRLMDMRIPLTFSEGNGRIIGKEIAYNAGA